jgi:hypothetical protein
MKQAMKRIINTTNVPMRAAQYRRCNSTSSLLIRKDVHLNVNAVIIPPDERISATGIVAE